ncbi:MULTISPECIES: copper homeostasis periplasmic binding protein CopC [Erwiniaceae]|jgi:methionine-rich copper-binding protein CopC|uniref:Copper resistance protein C n=3 Tax=Pantoea TaxID=53335 RepID=A0A7Y6TUD9_9GAMM|nr:MULTISPECIES: copper homeostasis periplasmic binding protein CopC [Erwiniaceae]POW45749.1 copper resistance protein CopC [Pantoea alvi]KKD30343.1 copper resistance protein CopC [Pantoea sp. 3.5.1]MBZ6397990.1 copper homeostasis periplasmic binding protein CopC [Pantoea sp.]MBZ6440980.1 copper homeostasis periplasmic binding protein CopC [Pantoea sp.]MDH1089176.1 copper homeostasis periplasmic binding protein CopC [Pantoea brenneri]
MKHSSAKYFIAVVASVTAFAVQAHPELASSVPADKAQVAAPSKVELHFTENLVTKFSGARLIMTAMPGMSSHAPMPVSAKVAAGSDPKTMIITPAKPLPAGTYKVEWRAVSSDTHPRTGNYSFSVK